jgi:hypothetical protein
MSASSLIISSLSTSCAVRRRKLHLSGCMRIEGPGLGLHGLAGGMAVQVSPPLPNSGL